MSSKRHHQSTSRIEVTTEQNPFGAYVVVHGTHVNPTRKFALIDGDVIESAVSDVDVREALQDAGYLGTHK